ncbi:hypothetical protein [Trujillonella humicola]|uniref:hypothetical protein n=1 Tax=Trujillonella humicola TaxID=3383699 RepID=UPI00390612C7
MSETSRARPVPGPAPGAVPRPVPAPPRTGGPAAGRPAEALPEAVPQPAGSAPGEVADRFAGLDRQPVGGHVEVFEAEHARLERELRTIEQL